MGQNFHGLATGKDFVKKFTRFNDHKISRLKFSRSEANPQKPRKFCPAKISRLTVYTLIANLYKYAVVHASFAIKVPQCQLL